MSKTPRTPDFIETDLKEIWPLKKLDETLQYLLDADQPALRQFTDIQKGIGWEADSKDLYEILEKLELDGYVKSEIRESNGIREYKSTFDGRFFKVETGGYLEKIQDEYQERKKQEADASYQLRYQSRSLAAVLLAGIGACALVIWEMFEFFWKLLCGK